jgi:hypothetical protein
VVAQDYFIETDRINMDPIRGTNVSLDIYLSALKAGDIQNKVALAGVKLALDTQKQLGQDLVNMLENLGANIDTYV